MPRLPSASGFLFWGCLWLTTAGATLSVDGLRVEELERPLGLDVAAPRLAWQLHSDQRGDRQTAYRVLVASSLDQLRAGRGDLWDSGPVAADDSFGVIYAGSPLRSGQRCFWQVQAWDRDGQPSAWSQPTWWQMGPLAKTDWSARWIGAAPDASSPLLRREFKAGRNIVRATAHLYAIGWYRCFVNGHELTERVLSPVNSNYAKGLFYDSYDVTLWLREGDNALGMWLGHGYSQNYSQYGYRWNQPPAAFVQLEIVYADGSTARVVSDDAWRWAPSPIVANDIYDGETYDARRESPGWSEPGFDTRTWQPVSLREAPPGPLKACPFPGLAIAQEIRPVKVTEPAPGQFVFDLGQNIAGWVRLKVAAAPGATVTLRHAEELHADGTLDPTTNRAAKATDRYVAAGRPGEVYEPRFTYHGFRYVEVSGLSKAPALDDLTGRVVRAAVAPTGRFHCSDAVLNRIHANFVWSLAGNLVGIPTDTAARDERTPCQMDSMAVEEAALANFGLAAYYGKWLDDISGDGGSLPGWTGDQVVLPYLLYQHSGDRRILERHFENMQQVVAKFAATADESRYWEKGYGDWAAPNRDGSFEGSFSEGEFVNTAIYWRCARLVTEVAQILGHPEAVARFSALADAVAHRLQERFYDRVALKYGSGRQVTSVLPLAFGFAPVADRREIVNALRHRITTRDNSHVDTGIFGTRYLFEVLLDAGEADLAHQLLTTPGYPGFVDQISRGATTTWEQWQFAGSMQTHNHAMFAGADATFYSRLGGIRPAAPGFRKIEIKPALPEALSFVECSQMTPLGKIATKWERVAGNLSLQVTVPVGATARIEIPGAQANSLQESGRPAGEAPGVSVSVDPDGRMYATVGSGDYHFTTPLHSHPQISTP